MGQQVDSISPPRACIFIVELHSAHKSIVTTNSSSAMALLAFTAVYHTFLAVFTQVVTLHATLLNRRVWRTLSLQHSNSSAGPRPFLSELRCAVTVGCSEAQ